MKRTLLYGIILTAVCFTTQAQLGPGYMGKRCAVGYGINFSPAVFGPNGQEASMLQIGHSEGGEMAFNSMHEGFIEYAFKSRTCIGFSGKYFKTTYANQAALEYTGNYSGSPAGMYTIKGIEYNLYFKFYPKRYVAPWGRYVILGAVFNRFVCFYDPSRMNVQSYDYNTGKTTTISPFGATEQDYVRGDLKFGWGRSRILFNRITLDYGVNFGIFALAGNVITTVLFDGEDGFSSGLRTSDYIERTSKRRVRQVSSMNVFIKLGVLVF
jgi:hypothetical protein